MLRLIAIPSFLFVRHFEVTNAFIIFLCRIEELPTPSKKLPPESTPYVFFTGFEPVQAQQYIKVSEHALFPHFFCCRVSYWCWFPHYQETIAHLSLYLFSRTCSGQNKVLTAARELREINIWSEMTLEHSWWDAASHAPSVCFRDCTSSAVKWRRARRSALIW